MFEVVLHKIQSVGDYMIIKGGLVLSFCLTLFLNAIGYPKQVILFIAFLIIADILTRFHSEVYKHYGYFSIQKFFQAWSSSEKVLTSRKLKNGFFTKIFFYSILLYIAHQTGITNELYFGKFVSNFMYSSLIILDSISICENMSESNFANANFIKKFFEKQRDNLMEKDSKD
jgi:hypothetical protein